MLRTVPMSMELRIRRLGWISKMSEEIPKGDLFHGQVLAAILEQTRMDKCPRMPRDG